MPAENTQSAQHRQNRLRGILLMTAGFACFSCADTISKVLTADYHPIQIVWIRQFGLLLAIVVLLALRGRSILRSRAPALQFLRGLAAIISALSFVFAIAYVPLADAVAVSFVAPFIVTLLSVAILRETVGIRRWSAILVGFLGTLVIIRPGFGDFHPAILLVLLAATAFAVRQIISRHLGSSETTTATIAFTSITAAVLLFIPMLYVWHLPVSAMDIGLMILLAVFAGFGEFLIIRALEIADAVVVAPMHYSLILFGTFWGYLVFAHLPDFWTWIGALIVTLSGLYTLHRETKKQT